MSSVSVKSKLLIAVSISMLLITGCSTSSTSTAEVEGGSVQVRKAALRTTNNISNESTSDFLTRYANQKRVNNSNNRTRYSYPVNNRAVQARPIPTQAQGKREVTSLDRVVWNAQKQQGKMYRYGGENPSTGFDCSGLTQFAFGRGAGVALPRTAADQYRAATKIPRAQAQKGDLVFFNTRGRRVSHVGIYLGDGRFVHAPRTGRAITTEALDGYWAKRLIGFGRIPGVCVPSV
jgi:cell wall-associated NlpC family hydrolase